MVKNKNVVITGCYQGIGRQTMITFAENGANVIACSYKKDVEFESLCLQLSDEFQVSIWPIYFDMFDNIAIKNAAKEIQKLKVNIDGLINIAGINRDALFNMVTHKDLIDTFQLNVFSQITFTQYMLKIMQKNKTKGSIIFTSSVAALDGNSGQTVYAASKAALIGMVKSLAIELGEMGIRVNAIAPGVIKTPMTDKLDGNIIKKQIGHMDLPRIGKPVEVANACMYLISDLSSHLTGQTIRIDGGIK